MKWHIVSSHSIVSLSQPLLSEHQKLPPSPPHVRLEALTKNSDIVQNVLAVFGLQVTQHFLCPLGTFTLQSSNVLVELAAWNS
ncbi:hypothetical protein [Bradyrhizobium arachidis]|uniref:hypothetical protein n=1 Tax=Bradyrhizobium arachidis TaxID=858423 RepID=UPI002162EA82|nr:hypothetical protein [Bradyrhizobium arachidis]UVO30310.1 hypothetical protein KUF59_06090 [Bradyrhizobium arachidis]